MSKGTQIKVVKNGLEVSVTIGDDVLTQTVESDMIDAVKKDFGVTQKAAVKFLVTMTAATLRNLGDDEAAQAEFQEVMMQSLKDGEDWSVGYLTAFSKQVLPAVEEMVKSAEKSGQDPATAVSIALGFPVDGAKSLVACIELMEKGLTEEQISEVFVAGLKGEDSKTIAARYGLLDEEEEKAAEKKL